MDFDAQGSSESLALVAPQKPESRAEEGSQYITILKIRWNTRIRVYIYTHKNGCMYVTILYMD